MVIHSKPGVLHSQPAKRDPGLELLCHRRLQHALAGMAGRILVCGGLYLDVKLEVSAYPREDTTCTCHAVSKARGGNSANTAVVLAELLPLVSVWWVGAVPVPATDPDAAFVLDALRRAGVETDLREEVSGCGLPTAYITVSRSTGSRTIVSTRNGLRELSPAHFSTALSADPAAWRWCHLECRQLPAVLHMAQAWADHAQRGAGLSVEVEKPSLNPTDLLPLLPLCDLLVFSRDFVEAHAADVVSILHYKIRPLLRYYPPPHAASEVVRIIRVE